MNGILNESATNLPQVFRSKIQLDFLDDILSTKYKFEPLHTFKNEPSPVFEQYLNWQQKITGSTTKTSLQLGFQLHEAEAENPNQWQLEFFLGSHQDPSFKFDLSDYWQHGKEFKATIQQQFGKNVEQQLLIQLAHAG